MALGSVIPRSMPMTSGIHSAGRPDEKASARPIPAVDPIAEAPLHLARAGRPISGVNISDPAASAEVHAHFQR